MTLWEQADPTLKEPLLVHWMMSTEPEHDVLRAKAIQQAKPAFLLKHETRLTKKPHAKEASRLWCERVAPASVQRVKALLNQPAFSTEPLPIMQTAPFDARCPASQSLWAYVLGGQSTALEIYEASYQYNTKLGVTPFLAAHIAAQDEHALPFVDFSDPERKQKTQGRHNVVVDVLKRMKRADIDVKSYWAWQDAAENRLDAL